MSKICCILFVAVRVCTYAATMPLFFEENQGQTDARARYVARGAGYTAFLTRSGVVISTGSSSVTLDLEGARRGAKLTPESPLEGYSNYYRGSEPSRWYTGIRHYGSVRARNILSGVDIVYHGSGSNLEFDLKIAPGAHRKDVALRIEGAASLSLNHDGDLEIHTTQGTLRQHKPIAWQGKDQVETTYAILTPNKVAIRIGKYDPQLALTIDPVVSYSTYLGGSQQDNANAIAVDSFGYSYVSGNANSLDFPTTSGVNQGPTDGFVAKINPAGTALVYATYIGGSGFEDVTSIALDSSGNAFVTGSTRSSNFPIIFTGTTAFAGYQDTFVAKIGPSGQIVASRFLSAGQGSDSGTAVATDPSGNAYVTGYTNASSFPVTTGSFMPNRAPGSYNTGFVAKLDSSLNVLYGTYVSGTAGDTPRSIAVDAGGHAFIGGSTASANFPTTSGAFQTAYSGGTDGFVAELNPSGSALVYATFLGGSSSDSINRISVDGAGNVYATGFTQSANFPVTAGAYSTSLPNQYYQTGFVTKIASGGAILSYSTYLGGLGNTAGVGIAQTPAGEAFVLGTTTSSDFPVTPGALQTFPGTGYSSPNHLFICKLNASGTSLVYSTYLGGTVGENAGGLALDANQGLYIAGSSQSLNFPVTPSALQLTNKTSSNTGIVTKIDFSSPILCNTTLSANSVTIPGHGGSGSFTINLNSGCPWVVINNSNYYSPVITVSGPQSGFGSATISYSVPQNSSTGSTITSSLTIDGGTLTPGSNVFTINQSVGVCTDPVFDAPSVNFDPSGGIHNVAVSLPSNCPWNLSGVPSWIVATTSSNSGGPGKLSLYAGPTAFGARQATITVATKTISIYQGGGSCILSVSSPPLNVGALLFNGTATFTTNAPSCAWSAYSNVSWIQINPGSLNGQGSGSIGFTVAGNPGNLARSGTLLIGDQLYQINQVAGPGAVSLSYTATPYSAPYSNSLGDGGPVANASVQPAGMVFDPAGNLYIADQQSSRVRRVDLNGIITTVAGGGTGAGIGDGGPATSATLSNPTAIAFDGSGRLYISDSSNCRIRRVAYNIITTIAGTGSCSYNGDNVPATSAPLSYPQGLVVDAAGNVIFAETYSGRIRRITPNGFIQTVAGTGTSGFSGDGGIAVAAQINNPTAVALDSSGNLYFIDSVNNRVRRITPAGIISTYAGNGTSGSTGDGGPATSATLQNAYSLGIDVGGGLLIGSQTSSTPFMRRVTSDGTIRSLSLSGLSNGYGYGGGGIATDSSGNIFTGIGYSLYKLTPDPSFCGYSTFSPADLPASGGTLSIPVATGPSCPWTATSDASWMTLTSGNQTGPGSATFTISPNPGPSGRLANVVVAGQNYLVAQAAPAASFTFTFTDSKGIQDMNGAQIVINPTLTGVNSCYILFGRPNLISLADDSGNHFNSSTLGVSAVLENSRCIVMLSQGSQSITGNTLTLNLTVVFKVFNSMNVWTNLSSTASGYLGFVQGSSYTSTPQALPTESMGVTPNSGSGQAQAFTFNFYDYKGTPDISGGQIVFNSTLSGVGGCYILFNANNVLSLADDSGTPATPAPFGSQSVQQNSQCILYLGSSYQAQTSQNLSVTVFVAFKPAFAGTRNIYASVTTNSGGVSNFPQIGNWIIPGSAPVLAALPLSPANPTGPSQSLTFTWSDPNGFADIASAQVNVGGCQVQFTRATGQIAINGGATGTLGSPVAIQNTQCIVNLAASMQFGAGNHLTLTLFITMKTAGAQDISTSATSNGSTTSAITSLGTWIVTSPTALTPISAVPFTGTAPANSFQPFTFTMSNPNGAAAIDGALLLFYPSLQGANACYILWGRSAGLSLASNDATTFTTGALGSSNLLQNTQCTVDPSKSFETETGNTVNLTVAVAFKAPFQAYNQVYSWLNVGDNKGVFSGWSLESRFTVK